MRWDFLLRFCRQQEFQMKRIWQEALILITGYIDRPFNPLRIKSALTKTHKIREPVKILSRKFIRTKWNFYTLLVDNEEHGNQWPHLFIKNSFEGSNRVKHFCGWTELPTYDLSWAVIINEQPQYQGTELASYSYESLRTHSHDITIQTAGLWLTLTTVVQCVK